MKQGGGDRKRSPAPCWWREAEPFWSERGRSGGRSEEPADNRQGADDVWSDKQGPKENLIITPAAEGSHEDTTGQTEVQLMVILNSDDVTEVSGDVTQ